MKRSSEMMLFAVALASFLSAAIGVGVFTRLARRAGLLDLPNHRSSHSVPTPRGAGAVLVAVVALVVALVARPETSPAQAAGWAALAVAVVSGIDDLQSLPSLLRLGVHVVCALVTVWFMTGSPSTAGSWLIFGGAILWIVGLTNAYNFMDGIDGLSGSQAIISGAAVALAAWQAGLPDLAVAGVAVTAAALGFLLHNWPPARVFLGDVGSAFLGFSFAVFALQASLASIAAGTIIVLSLWPFIFDTGVTLCRRLLERENIFASHRSHLYQRLVSAGWPHKPVTMLYAGLSAAGAAAALVWAVEWVAWPVLTTVPLMAAGLYASVLLAERDPGHGSAETE